MTRLARLRRTFRHATACIAAALAAGSANAERAVMAPAIEVVIPSYGFSVTSEGSWSDEPRGRSHDALLGAAGVVPVGDAFGLRIGLSGGVNWFQPDGSGTVSTRDVRGRVIPEVAFFWRDPNRFELGLGLGFGFGFGPVTVKDQGQWLDAWGALFLGDFDLQAGLGYSHGDAEFRDPAAPALALTTSGNGVTARGAVSYYPREWAALSLSGFYDRSWSEARFVGGELNSEGEGGGITLRSRFLPLWGERGWLVLDVDASFDRGTVWSTTPGDPSDRSSANTYTIGGALRVVLPGVTSLRELRRHY